MSAANRTRKDATVAERRPADDYPTPAWVTRAILPHLMTPRTILEPACGIGAMMRELFAYWPKAFVKGIEIDGLRANEARGIRPGKLTEIDTRDALTTKHALARADLIITNPPFSLAIEFVEQALASDALECAFLLRLAFLESKRRAAFHRANPSDIYVLPERPSFAWFYSCPINLIVGSPGCGRSWSEVPGVVHLECPHCGRDLPNVTKNDMAAYAWFVWRRGSKGGHWQILDAEAGK